MSPIISVRGLTKTYGRIRLVNVRWLVHSYAEQHQLLNWKRDQRQGGGVLPLLGSHFFQYMEWLFGPIVKMSAYLSPFAAEVEARVDAWFCAALYSLACAALWASLKFKPECANCTLMAFAASRNAGFCGVMFSIRIVWWY